MSSWWSSLSLSTLCLERCNSAFGSSDSAGSRLKWLRWRRRREEEEIRLMALLRLFTFTWKETKAKEKHFLVGKKTLAKKTNWLKREKEEKCQTAALEKKIMEWRVIEWHNNTGQDKTMATQVWKRNCQVKFLLFLGLGLDGTNKGSPPLQSYHVQGLNLFLFAFPADRGTAYITLTQT